MTTYGVDEQELFPFCDLYLNEFTGNGAVIGLTDDEHADYERVMGEFRAWQKRLTGAIRLHAQELPRAAASTPEARSS